MMRVALAPVLSEALTNVAKYARARATHVSSALAVAAPDRWQARGRGNGLLAWPAGGAAAGSGIRGPRLRWDRTGGYVPVVAV